MVIKLQHSLHAVACKLEISCSWFRSKKIVFKFLLLQRSKIWNLLKGGLYFFLLLLFAWNYPRGLVRCFLQKKNLVLLIQWGTAVTKGKTPVPICSLKLSPVGQGWYLNEWSSTTLCCTPGTVDINDAFHLYYNVLCGSSFSRSQPDFEGFLRELQFPPSAKLTPSLIQHAGPHW